METLLELYLIPSVLLFPAVIINREELNGCSTPINLTQLIWGMWGHPAWPAQRTVSPIHCLQQHPWAGTQGRVMTDVHKIFSQALPKLLIISCSGNSDIVSCLVTQSSFFEIFFLFFPSVCGFYFIHFWWGWQENIHIRGEDCFSVHEEHCGKNKMEVVSMQ